MTPRLRDGDLIPDLALGSDDPDDFEYEAIAGPVADLVCSGRTPISVALFGPWGSGKSSIGELVRRELEARTPAVAFVHYDAWRYGGSSLKRNFIAHAARELKLTDDARDQEFHRGLFENRKAVELHPGRLGIAFRSALRGVPVVLLLSLTFCSVISGLVLLADLLIDIDASALLGQILVPGGIAVAGSLALIKAFVDVGRIEIDQSKPSEDDQFTATFARLISRVTSAQDDSSGSGAKGRLAQRGRRLSSWASRQPGPAQFRTWWSGAELPTDPVPERVVFFIDELDRCREDDVVATLNAIRTFLEAERCAFIVAADRDVIERALDEVDQATPRNPSDPYYTSAGAFLDKIFNHQISLPPMRARRLNTWARSAALRRRDGLWEELASRGSSASTPDLDDVLFHLIPSHVKSPRRVKVLMNAFATNVRIAQARVPSCWPAERSVLARLTALQVEFPNFAADLRTEPRLPRLAVSGQSDELNDASAKLVSKWALAGDGEPSDLINGSGGRTVPDGTTTDSGFTQLQRQQRIQLARYLERTSGLSDTPRSLLFLDSTGAEVGIEDLALGELVEAEATDSPKAVAEAIVGKSTQEKQGVARLLATMVHEVLTPERGNVMTALMHVSNELGPAVQGVVREVAEALRAFRVSNALEPFHLVGAVRIAAASSGPGDEELTNELLATDELWAAEDRVLTTIDLLPDLPRSSRRIVSARFPDAALAWHEVAKRAAHLPAPFADELLTDGCLDQLFAESETDDDVEEVLDAFVQETVAHSEKTALLERCLASALNQRAVAALAVIDRHANPVLNSLPVDRRDSLAVEVASRVPPESCLTWLERLSDEKTSIKEAGPLAQTLIGRAGAAATEQEVEGLTVELRLVAPRIDPDTEGLDAWPNPIGAALARHEDWSINPNANVPRVAWLRMLAAISEFLPTERDTASAFAVAHVSAELNRPALDELDHEQVDLAFTQISERVASDILENMPPWEDEADGESRIRWFITNLRLLKSANALYAGWAKHFGTEARRAAGWTIKGRSDVVWPPAEIAIALWLEARPEPGPTSRVVRALQGRPSGVIDDALRAWATRESNNPRRLARGNMLVGAVLLKQGIAAPERLGAISSGPLMEAPLIQKASDLILDESSTVLARRTTALTLAGGVLKTDSARSEVARICRELLDRKRLAGDLDVVLAALPTLNDSYTGRVRLSASVVAAFERAGRKPTAPEMEILTRAGIDVPSSLLTKRSSAARQTLIEAADSTASWLAKVLKR